MENRSLFAIGNGAVCGPNLRGVTARIHIYNFKGNFGQICGLGVGHLRGLRQPGYSSVPNVCLPWVPAPGILVISAYKKTITSTQVSNFIRIKSSNTIVYINHKSLCHFCLSIYIYLDIKSIRITSKINQTIFIWLWWKKKKLTVLLKVASTLWRLLIAASREATHFCLSGKVTAIKYNSLKMKEISTSVLSNKIKQALQIQFTQKN